jgi:hypothetical protein
VVGVEEGPRMADYTGAWYRIYDELDSNVPYFVPAIHLRVLPTSYFDPISPEVPFEDKLIELNLTTQTLVAYEYGKSVFQTNISRHFAADRSAQMEFPQQRQSKFNILSKVPSKHGV